MAHARKRGDGAGCFVDAADEAGVAPVPAGDVAEAVVVVAAVVAPGLAVDDDGAREGKGPPGKLAEVVGVAAVASVVSFYGLAHTAGAGFGHLPEVNSLGKRGDNDQNGDE